MNNIHKNIDNYYTEKVKKYGATPRGVDWNGEESQTIRFEQLSKIIIKDNFTLADIGCGYGKYSEYLELNYTDYTYTGYDLSKEMLYNAIKLYKTDNVNFLHIDKLDTVLAIDYSIASGIFSVKMEHTESEWLLYILETLEIINKISTNGFAFNMLTKYSDKEYMRDNLYYADPLFFFDYCKNNFSRNVSLNHDYDLYEFTILVKKD
jgi:SAM-dependent methyltransferase